MRLENSKIPTVANTDNSRERSRAAKGLQNSIAVSAIPTALNASDSRRNSSAENTAADITAARRTDGAPPVSTAKKVTNKSPRTARARRGTRIFLKASNRYIVHVDRCKPETTRRCEMPEARKAFVLRSDSRVLTPKEIQAITPPASFGSRVKTACVSAWRRDRIAENKPVFPPEITVIPSTGYAPQTMPLAR